MVVFFRGEYNELSILCQNKVQNFGSETHLVEGNAHLPKSSGVFSQHEDYLEACRYRMGF